MRTPRAPRPGLREIGSRSTGHSNGLPLTPPPPTSAGQPRRPSPISGRRHPRIPQLRHTATGRGGSDGDRTGGDRPGLISRADVVADSPTAIAADVAGAFFVKMVFGVKLTVDV